MNVSPAAALTAGVAAAMSPAPPALPASATLGEAVAAMAASRASAILALSPDGRPAGILTEQDVTRRVAFRLAPEAPVSAAMTAPLIAARAGDGLWRAIALLRAHRLRHLPVLDEAGACVGILHRAETLAAASGKLLSHLDALAGDDAEVKRAQAGVAAALLAEGVDAASVVGLVSEINLDLHRRILERAIAAAGTAPPVPFTLLIMGSGGRGESLLGPDQDNGFLLGEYPDAEHAAVDAWFRPVAAAFNAALDAAGFPLCKGGVMAQNPLWRKRGSEWQRQFELWAIRRSGAALLFADIAFDFRPCWGDPAPAATLRAHLGRVLAGTPAFLAALAQQDSRFGVGLTLFGGFADDEPGEGTRTDLKLHGLMPLVAAARLGALRAGAEGVATPARLAGLAGAGALSARDEPELQEAFRVLLDAVLRQQLADHEAGRAPGNLVDTAALAKAERARLKEALKAVRSFANATWAGFTGRMW
jgi:signal-transduction protein with cAMP-binding, CBS, and nucleotidyltransferase domain